MDYSNENEKFDLLMAQIAGQDNRDFSWTTFQDYSKTRTVFNAVFKRALDDHKRAKALFDGNRAREITNKNTTMLFQMLEQMGDEFRSIDIDKNITEWPVFFDDKTLAKKLIDRKKTKNDGDLSFFRAQFHMLRPHLFLNDNSYDPNRDVFLDARKDVVRYLLSDEFDFLGSEKRLGIFTGHNDPAQDCLWALIKKRSLTKPEKMRNGNPDTHAFYREVFELMWNKMDKAAREYALIQIKEYQHGVSINELDDLFFGGSRELAEDIYDFLAERHRWWDGNHDDTPFFNAMHQKKYLLDRLPDFSDKIKQTPKM